MSEAVILVVDVGTIIGARRGRAAPTRPSTASTHARRCSPTRPPPVWSSSTRRCWPSAALDLARAALAAGGPVDAVGIAEPARLDDRVGPRHRRADRPRARLAGPAHGRRAASRCGPTDFALGAEPVGDEGRVPARRSSTPQRDPRPVLRHRRHVGRVDALRGRAARHRRDQRRDHRPGRTATRRAGHRACSRRCASRAGVLPADRRLDRRRSAPRRALPGAPPIAALVGDQQASLVGQGCVRPGDAKITFGTGGMLDVVLGDDAPAVRRHAARAGTFPIIAWRARGRRHVGPRGDHARGRHQRASGCATTSASSRARTSRTTLAAQCADTGGVCVRARAARLGTPQWDYGARGTVLGLTRGTGRPEIVRAVLEGIAHRGADLVEAAEADAGSRSRRCASTAA